MSVLSECEEKVGRYYDDVLFDAEVMVKLNELSEAQADAWLDLIERAETLMPDALGMADHFLHVGQKSHDSLANHGANEGKQNE
jgi:hypothetical protein